MLSSPRLKRLAFNVLGSPLALRIQLSRIAASGALTILNLHRVDDRGGSAYAAIKPAVFDELLAWLCRRFQIVRFSELEAVGTGNKPPLILSFDDGYKDFVDFVAPILRKHSLSANQNIVPTCVELGRPPMNVILQDFIGTAPSSLLREIEIPGLTCPIDPDDRALSGQRASAALKNKPIAEQKDIFTGLQLLFERFDSFRPTQMMTLHDIRSISAEHEIGAHSWEHASMAHETDEYLTEDAVRCRVWCAEQVGVEPCVYALPNGSARAGQAEIIRSQGFPFVLAVGEDFSRREAWLHKRFTMYGATASETRFRALGGFRRLRAAPVSQPRE